MKYDQLIGLSAENLGWVPSPGFILRRAALLELFNEMAPGTVLEMGCGPGAMLHELGRLGFQPTGVEISQKARALAGHLRQEFNFINVLASLDGLPKGHFDYLCAFEVLEHIRYDHAALALWVEYLKPGGLSVISVPAHRQRWNVTDKMAGHFRRYDRCDLEALILNAGLEICHTQTYGWPFTRVLEILRLLVKQAQLKRHGVDPQNIALGDVTLSKQSGNNRRIEGKLFWFYSNRFLGRPIVWMLTRMQQSFFSSEHGISHIVVAKKAK